MITYYVLCVIGVFVSIFVFTLLIKVTISSNKKSLYHDNSVKPKVQKQKVTSKSESQKSLKKRFDWKEIERYMKQ